jgi:hypothetical protein
MTTRRALLIGAASAVLSACASSSGLVGGAERQQYSTGITFGVTLTRQWSDLTFSLPNRPRNLRMLSVDGPLLNRLYLASLEPEQSLLRPSDRDTPRPTYRADMSDTEVVEFVIDCIAQEYQAPEASALRPQTFAGQPGVRFEIATRTSDGLLTSGTALAARAGERLQIMLYLAPSEHYYAALLPDVETIFASATPA